MLTLLLSNLAVSRWRRSHAYFYKNWVAAAQPSQAHTRHWEEGLQGGMKRSQVTSPFSLKTKSSRERAEERH